MMPHGAPTTWFSTAWQAAARSAAGMGLPQPAVTAAAAATSSAADDATPLPSGTVESMMMRRPQPARQKPRSNPATPLLLQQTLSRLASYVVGVGQHWFSRAGTGLRIIQIGKH